MEPQTFFQNIRNDERKTRRPVDRQIFNKRSGSFHSIECFGQFDSTQDCLGGVIVFVAIVTALLAAKIACNNYNKQQHFEQQHSLNNSNNQNVHVMTTATRAIMSLTPTPSLVGLAINYTLLMPIYLNWVVKLLADMEMYIGSVERIAYYANASEKIDDKKRKKFKQTDEQKPTELCANANNITTQNHVKHESNEDIKPAETSTTTFSVNHNDKWLNFSKNNKTTDNSVNTTNATGTSATNMADDNNPRQHHHHHHKNVANDGYKAAVAIKTLSNKEQTTTAVAKVKASNVQCVDNNDKTKIAKLPQPTTTTPEEISFESKKLSSISNTNTSSKLLERNDAERQKPASLRRSIKTKKEYKPVAISWPQHGDISFQNVSLRYEGQTEDVIKNLNLMIPAGQKIGICGRTGSGKSSLALSLFDVLQITHGCIRIDGNDIASIHPDEIRTRLSIIPQDVHLFNMTVRDNLDPSGYYSDLELWKCLELAQLKEFVNTKMPQGLDTEIMDGGLNLSVGYRQLFCLARAILRGSVCLVLDEATSSLDATTEKALLDAAHKAFQGRTIITIAHRLATIMDYDRIIVLDRGKVIEDGTPAELQQKPNGIFSTLLHSGRPLSTLSLDDVLNTF